MIKISNNEVVDSADSRLELILILKTSLDPI